MSNYYFYPMTKEKCDQISTWTYEEPYSFYNMDRSHERINELMNGEYYYVSDLQGFLFGFICIGESARVRGGYEVGLYNNNDTLDIGLGIIPDFTGRGNGKSFIDESIRFLIDKFKVQKFQLVVAEFNERAIKVYQSIGFIKGLSFRSIVKDQEVNFIVMNYSINVKNM